MKGTRYALSALFIMAGFGLLALGLYAHPSLNASAGTIKAAMLSDRPVTTTTPDVTDTPISTPIPECGFAWRVVDSPSPGTGSQLFAVSGIGSNDIWAVGSYFTMTNPRARSLVEHWNSFEWNVVPSPYFQDERDFPRAVVAISPSDAWAVGEEHNYVGRTHALRMHWAGTQWNNDVFDQTGRDDNLTGIAAISSNDVWAIGYFNDLSCCYTIIWHWDGASWTLAQNPAPGRGPILRGVSAVSSSDVWAVGTGFGQPSTLHWDGAQWNIVASPTLTYTDSGLNSINAISTNDIWAAGYSSDDTSDHSLVEHWDGSQWSVIPSPDVGILNGISAASANNVWAINERNGFLHWDGTSWSASSGPSNPNYALSGIVAVSPDNVWAVGSTNGYSGQTLIERYNDPCSPRLIGHVTWQGPPPQPSVRQQLPITLTLKSNSVEMNYPAENTNANGYFEANVASLPAGNYQWRAKGPKYLANAGTLTFDGTVTTTVDMGTLVVGDANNDNQVGVSDFNIIKGTFGRAVGEPAYDERAEFTGDSMVNIVDFGWLRNNFGRSGAPPQ